MKLQSTLVSIVIPLHNEEGNVRELTDSILNVMDELTYPFEVIMVNDGSTDKTALKMSEMARLHPEVVGIDLAGNYGQTMALRVGFEHSRGEIIIAMDGDLQHDPQYLPIFLEQMEKGYDMVGGAKEKRPDGWLKSRLSEMAHSTIANLTGVKMSYFGATFKAYRRCLLENINMLGDDHRFLGAIVARKGISYTEIPIIINERKHGKSSYKFDKIFKVMIDLLFLKFMVKYMKKPFRFFGPIGVLLSIIGLLGVITMVLGSLFLKVNIKESLLVEFVSCVSLIISGLTFLSIGILAEIGAHNYFNSHNQSPYSIRKIWGKSDSGLVYPTSGRLKTLAS
jgi:glycosyltransferase involved in cell wall biosynthesis